MSLISYRQALNHALAEEIIRDSSVFIIGEEVAQYNGAYKVTEGLWERFGSSRIYDTPISEAAFLGLSIGAAMMGLRPVVELMFWSFAYVGFDQIVNNAACIRYMSGGLVNIPIVIRGPSNGGTNVGATHSHTPENFLANTPGLKVVAPATPYDAKGLLISSIRDNDPVCFMENTLLYGNVGHVPDESYTIPIGLADIKKTGSDVSLIAYGRAVITCLEAANILSEKYSIDAEVIDLRSLRPLDKATIFESVSKTHRVVLVDENKPYCGITAQISAILASELFDELDAPILRVSATDTPSMYSMPLEKLQIPDAYAVIEKVLSHF